MRRILFLPGAAGAAAFWRPAADRLPADWDTALLAWPGLGDEAHDPAVAGLDDLVRLVLDRLDTPADLAAQSMGGLVALKCALARPQAVRSLTLCGTSGGLDVAALGGADWRDDYRRTYPGASDWIMDAREDLTPRLGDIAAPALLLWGDADEISPAPVGRRLEALMPNARLRTVAGGAHDFPVTHAETVAPMIRGFLERQAATAPPSPFGL